MDKTLRPERPSISVARSSRSRARFPWLQMSVVTLSVSIPAGSMSHFRQIATATRFDTSRLDDCRPMASGFDHHALVAAGTSAA
jgi:hypothetical protein